MNTITEIYLNEVKHSQILHIICSFHFLICDVNVDRLMQYFLKGSKVQEPGS